MKLGCSLRLMGEAATRQTLLETARAAEAAGLDEIWLPDHVAIPPDDAEGSGGRYLDILSSLAFLAGATERIGLGTGVLILPYRRPLPIAKAVATAQELSGGRVRLGVGIGWMDAEFTALGISRRNRGSDADACLDLLVRCFAAPDDVVTEHGQPFLFRPHPQCPPILVGGRPPHALERAVRYGDGWMPMSADPDELAPAIESLRARFADAGKGEPEVVAFGVAQPGEPARGADHIERMRAIGVTRLLFGGRYATADEFRRLLEAVLAVREAAGLAP